MHKHYNPGIPLKKEFKKKIRLLFSVEKPANVLLFLEMF